MPKTNCTQGVAPFGRDIVILAPPAAGVGDAAEEGPEGGRLQSAASASNPQVRLVPLSFTLTPTAGP
jgi:hypothetical protein